MNSFTPRFTQWSGISWLGCVCFLTLQVATFRSAEAQQQDWIQSWLFNGRTEASVRQGLQNQAEQKLVQLKDVCNLSDEQLAKLKLAAAGDVNRFFHDVAKARKATLGIDQQNQNHVQAAWNVVSPLSTRLNSGIYDEKSLFTKVMACTLDSAQVAEYKRMIQEQLDRRDHALVLTTVSTIEKSLPLIGEQRAKLIALLDSQKIKPIRQQGMEPYVGYAKLAMIPAEELESLLDKEQLKTLEDLRVRYAPFVQMLAR